MSASGYVHVQVDRIANETLKAFLCVIDGEEVWLPKSQVADAEDYERGDTEVELSITEYIAKEKGLA